ncbi:hypothetical protein [Sphingobium lignivorans]|uniref:AAA+ ATPase domain-containing protein n=1 Tax=Sphingobium lignivorans TaxID=2735886 RepID=A0ABR6NE14_9SPHN|nr:hypothetical protein [Sphingobium lignivorans]MBB5985486.1 hypothetical protein [Sphingobium lignivorans]
MDPRTIKALAELTDEGRFEQIALAVLHHAEPLCAAFSQQGVNAFGKTRASPVDNIGFVRAVCPAHMVVAHHTTAAERGLKAKWMAAGPRIGDILKTAEVVAEERVRTPDLKATLFLTTNREPDERLVRDSVALGASHGMTVEIWSRARLAHVLDTDPAGQRIRRVLLDIEQELLSPELLSHLSTTSLESFAPVHERGVWIGRDLDRRLLQSRQPVSFIMGESGSGKSVACFCTMSQWVAGGDFALVIPEDVVDEATSLSGAILTALQRLHPQLADTPSALALASTSRPLLLLVEDINHANNPSRAIEKIARWAAEPASGERRGAPAWRILCPLWPSAIHGLPDSARRLIEPMLVQPSPFTDMDGIAAVAAKARVAYKSISTVGCHALSKALGNDPLLIGLHEFGGTSAPKEIIADFVERAMHRCEGQTSRPAGELRAALSRLSVEMLERCRMSPTWTEILQWPGLHPDLDAIRQLVAASAVVRLEGRSDRQVLVFRHDRVRDHLLVDAAASLHSAGTMSDALLEDPFYAAILGDLVYARLTDEGLLERVSHSNPSPSSMPSSARHTERPHARNWSRWRRPGSRRRAIASPISAPSAMQWP